MAGNTSKPGATVVVARAGAAVRLRRRHRRLTLTELARRADLPLPTAHRLVNELVAGGALVAHGPRRVRRRATAVGRRSAGPGADRAASGRLAVPQRPARRDAGHRAPRGPRADPGALPRATSGSASVPVVSPVGSRLPMHATGVGKVLLAHAPAESRNGCSPA